MTGAIRTATRLAAPLLLGVAGATAQTPTVTEQTSGVRAGLVAVSAVSEQVAWASGGSGTILRTIDGGVTWQSRQIIMPGTPKPDTVRQEFRDIHALSADLAWVMSIGNGAASRIYRTTDGGTSWTAQFLNTDAGAFYDCITMFDAKHGVAFSDTPPDGKLRILRTEDGEHWNLIPSTALPAALKGEGGFASSGGCLVSSGDKHGWIAAGTPESRVFRTSDAGKSWEVFSTPLLALQGDETNPGGMTAVAFRDPLHGIAVASRINTALDTSSAAVATTDDGGKSWTLRRRPPPGALYGVTWVPGLKTTAIGSSLGGLMLTHDGGESWTAITGTSRYWGIGAAGKTAWGVGPGGRITKVEFK